MNKDDILRVKESIEIGCLLEIKLPTTSGSRKFKVVQGVVIEMYSNFFRATYQDGSIPGQLSFMYKELCLEKPEVKIKKTAKAVS